MLMAIDQAGEQIATGEIDGPGAADQGRGEPRRGQHRLDPLAVHDHRHVALRRPAGAVDQGGAAVDDAFALMRGSEGWGAKVGEASAEREENQ
jgi:hypothetical protein